MKLKKKYKDSDIDKVSNVADIRLSVCYLLQRYSSYDNRLESLIKASDKIDKNVNLEKIAEAGFFYEGPDGITRCFDCGITICDWDGKTDAYTVHVSLRPWCRHLSIFKTEKFIKITSRNYIRSIDKYDIFYK